MEPLGGLHHVTAITADAPGNVAFYRGTLGLRLVKKTVNQDDVSAYHLFYADAQASPGTDVTFFAWPRSAPSQPGVPSLGPIALSVVDEAAVGYWEERLAQLGTASTRTGDRLAFSDPEGQRFELVPGAGSPPSRPWDGTDVPGPFQIQRLHGITVASPTPETTAQLLTQVMGFQMVAEGMVAGGDHEQRFELGPGGPGFEVKLRRPADPRPSQQGRGGVHHVAFRVPDDEAHQSWRERLASNGIQVTTVIDRFYFKSIYFREPGGNLFEIATDGPGFTADEPLDELGKRLALPPFLEPNRAAIEAGLAPLPT